jgi:hypothetical protein
MLQIVNINNSLVSIFTGSDTEGESQTSHHASEFNRLPDSTNTPPDTPHYGELADEVIYVGKRMKLFIIYL